jgi:excisionase family DNA binding protein
LNAENQTVPKYTEVEGLKREQRKVRTGETVEISDEIMSAKDAARYLKIALPTFYRYLKEEDIPAVKIGGRYKFLKSALDGWLRTKMEEAVNEKRSRNLKLFR